MLIDASAIIAVLKNERKSAEILSVLGLALEKNVQIYVAPVTIYEAVVGFAFAQSETSQISADQIKRSQLIVAAFMDEWKIEEVTIGPAVSRIAIDAVARFGKRVGHRAALNFGDCYVYATAKSLRLPLLYVGNDFSQTDLRSVLSNPSAQ